MNKVTLFFMIVIFMKRVNSLTIECSLWIWGRQEHEKLVYYAALYEWRAATFTPNS